MRIRRYEPEDLSAVYDICVRTAASGTDARGMYSSDDLMPDFFAGPYLYFEPELGFVLDDGVQPVGYVIGTADTRAFVRRYRDEWIPRLADRYPVPPEPPTTAEEAMIALHYLPERMLWPQLADYPAHLHIDLLSGFQRFGHGRALVETFLPAAAAHRDHDRPQETTAGRAAGRWPGSLPPRVERASQAGIGRVTR